MDQQMFSRFILRNSVAKICQTIGWHTIQNTPLELLIDFLHRYLQDLCKVTHRYSEQFGQTAPNLDHLGLAFQDLNINLSELEDYVKNVESVPCNLSVPKYPVERETHLNFLKPGSNEVVHRPVHVHEHLPPMHPDLEDTDKKTPLLPDAPAITADGVNGNVFKRPGDPLESPAMKRTRMILDEEGGRPMREISSVIMTTSGFLSPAREGKLPETRAPFIPVEVETRSPTPSAPTYQVTPPDVKNEKKSKKSLSKKPQVSKKSDKETTKKKDKTNKPEKVKKISVNKDTNKVKGPKNKTKPTSIGEGNPKDFANFIQNLYQNSTQNKHKQDEVIVPREPNLVEKIPEPNLLDGKLSTEPDKQKLNIFKKISKVKEEKNDKEREELPRETRDNLHDVAVDDAGPSWKNSISSSTNVTSNAPTPSSVIEDDEVYISDTLSPPGTPATPKTPELPSKLDKSRKRKREKSKSKSKLKVASNKKAKIETIDLEDMDRPKTPELPPVPPNLFTFPPHFPPMPGLLPPMMHPMFPALQFLKQNAPTPIPGLPHPAMPNLPIPPPNFMQPMHQPQPIPPPVPVKEEPVIPVVEPVASPIEKPVEKEKKPKDKEAKKEDKKPKKKKLKKEKVKNKEKGEKKKDKEEKKVKDKEKSKEKKEKKKEKEREQREERPEPSVPKLTLKLGLDSSRSATPEQNRKIAIKPIVKKDDVPIIVNTKRAGSPELARISPLFTRQPKISRTPAADVPESSTSADVKTDVKVKESSKKSAPSTSKDTVAYYHHAGSGSAAGKSSRRLSTGASKGLGDDAGNQVWICPSCKGPDDGSPMIGCDDCDAWYHWVCVGIQVPPDDKENWYCRECILRKQDSITDKKGKKIKKKNK